MQKFCDLNECDEIVVFRQNKIKLDIALLCSTQMFSPVYQ